MYLEDAGLAYLYLQNPSGGLFEGDRLEVRIEAGPGACVHVTTPSATRVHPGRSRQIVELAVAAGSYVEYAPEPVIPFAGADYEQQVEADVAPGGRLLLSELVAPGRMAHGERFAYERLALTTRVRVESTEVIVDRLLLEPARRSPARRGLLGRYAYLGTLLAVGPGATALTPRLADAIASVPGALGGSGATAGETGAVARVVAETRSAAGAALAAAFDAVRAGMLGAAVVRRK
jgi:urease accessory protein